MSAWEEQFKRMARALKKVEQPKTDDEEALDDIYSFFQNCWHLKDWIQHDDSLPPKISYAIVRDAHKMESLRFCADLANGSKHLKLDKMERHGAKLLRIGKLAVSDAKTGEILSSSEIGYVIGSKNGSPAPSDVIGFSLRAFQDWKDLLAKYKLGM
jgi:hypothetical protein